jgi:hypothetical protein
MILDSAEHAVMKLRHMQRTISAIAQVLGGCLAPL